MASIERKIEIYESEYRWTKLSDGLFEAQVPGVFLTIRMPPHTVNARLSITYGRSQLIFEIPTRDYSACKKIIEQEYKRLRRLQEGWRLVRCSEVKIHDKDGVKRKVKHTYSRPKRSGK